MREQDELKHARSKQAGRAARPAEPMVAGLGGDAIHAAATHVGAVHRTRLVRLIESCPQR